MFDSKGAFVPSSNHQVFSYPSSNYYRYNPDCQSNLIKPISRSCGISADDLTILYDELRADIQQDQSLKNILNGPSLPFYLQHNDDLDVGSLLESNLCLLLTRHFVMHIHLLISRLSLKISICVID